MTWQDQGRQQHGWFGHGRGSSTPGSSDGVLAAKVAYSAYAHLPPARRAGYESWLDRGGLRQIAAILPAWTAGALLPEQRFRTTMLGPGTPGPVAAHAQTVGASLALEGDDAGRHADAAGRHFAALVETVPPGSWGRTMADAAAQVENLDVGALIEQIAERPVDGPDGARITLAAAGDLKCQG